MQKTHKMCCFFFFLTKLKPISRGVWVRVLFGGNHHPSAVPPLPGHCPSAPPSPAPLEAGRDGGDIGWAPSHSGQPELGGVSSRMGGRVQPVSGPPAPSDTGHTNRVLPGHVGFDICRLHYKTVNENYIRTSPAVSFF